MGQKNKKPVKIKKTERRCDPPWITPHKPGCQCEACDQYYWAEERDRKDS